MSDGGFASSDEQFLVSLAAGLQRDYDENAAVDWTGSPFLWIKQSPSARRGAVAAKLVEAWCVRHGLSVAAAPDSDCDRLVSGVRTEIKSSTLWDAGFYKFQQIRDQNFAVIICWV